ncbi:MAG: hypothetical protein JXA78_10590 [Anaerolineales bacterium]|nr:hypothetical protein [Anaerolineales bacterium]
MSSMIPRAIQTTTKRLASLGLINLLGFILCVAVYSFLVVGPPGACFTYLPARLALFALLALLGSVFLKAWQLTRQPADRMRWIEAIGVSALLAAFGYKIATFIPDISTYPLTLTWSETSRYYYASLFFSKSIYGEAFPPTVLHPSRYLMQAVPFLLPASPLWLHRAWQVALWIAMPLLTACFLVRRLAIEARLKKWLVLTWSALFLLLGPVYYHLLVPLIIVLWGFQANPQCNKGKLISWGAVVLASAWAGISRINWFPVPGMLAATLILLESPALHPSQARPEGKAGFKKWRSTLGRRTLIYAVIPVAWTIFGAGVAFASQAFYIILSGNQAEEFTSSLTSNLMWHRLLPSPTYPPGILPAIALVSLPMVLLIFGKLFAQRSGVPTWQRYHPIRLLELCVILLVLFVGGLIVSIKIGGGSNLHNLDAYLALLWVVSGYIHFDRAAPDLPIGDGCDSEAEVEHRPTSRITPRAVHRWGVSLALAVTIFFIIVAGGPASPLPDQKSVETGLFTIAEYAQAASRSGGEVLFISNRHLLTFHNVEGVPLVPDYERVFLMEMAMAGNARYLEAFQRDSKEHRFALIITEPLSIQQKEGLEVFGPENNAWVKQVARYLLCYYKPEKTLRSVQVQLLVPNPDATNCP